ncbi:RNaseH domain-containing protein [Lentzea sp. NPDC051208]|uniref:RNaseH domain-containing protein n=1 Tax=Lentzea sp. NPDC051208 TaxID=3154642 RepID=UPI003443C61C
MNTLNGHPLAAHRLYEFPPEWASPLREKVFPSLDPEQPRSIPLWATNEAIAMLLPQVLTHDARGRAGTPWLAWAINDGTPEPDPQLLVELVRGGLIAAALDRNAKMARWHRPPAVDLTALQEVLVTFKPEHLRHTVRTTKIEAGQELEPVDYTLIAQMFATHLVASGWQVEHSEYSREDGALLLDKHDEPIHIGHGRSHWRRTAARDVGAELISNVHVAKKGKREYPWSYTLRLSVQNIPLDGSVVLHAAVGMRRWTASNAYDASRAIGVHLFTPSPWADEACPIGVASIKWQPGPKGKKQGAMRWNDDLAPVLERLTSTEFLPDPVQLARDPLTYMNLEDGGWPLAAVPFRYGLGKNCRHAVGDGVSVRDRKRIFDALRPALADFATPSEPFVRHHVARPPRRTSAEIQSIRSEDLAAAAGERVELTLWWDTDVMRREAIAAVTKALGVTWPLDQDDTATTSVVFELSGLQIAIRQIPVGDIAAPLQLDGSVSAYRDRIAQAASIRREFVRDAMTAARDRSLPDAARFALIEMANADAFGRDQDPKQQVKLAAGQVDVLTQNLTPPQKEVEEGKRGGETASSRKQRTAKAVGDLLTRQTGLLHRPRVLGTPTTPLNDVTPLGLWVVRRNGDARAVLPMAVAWLPDVPYATMRLPGPDNTWLPYHKAMLRLSTWNTERRFKDKDVHGFFAEVLEEAADGSDIALFTHTQNIRSNCPGMANGHLLADTLAFDPEHPFDIDRLKGVRHLRLRTNLRHETTQQYAFNSKDELRELAGIAAGLWQHPRHDRLFFSLADKPGTATTTGSPGGSRLEPHWGRTGKKDENDNPILGWKFDTFKDVWNPQMLEVLFALKQEGDDSVAWAAFAHQQRYTAAHFADPLLLPGVLHLAQKAGEYLLPSYERESLVEKDF